MAVYVISDIHGNYDLFMELLKKIKFSSKRQSIIEKEYVGTQPYICALTEIKYSLPRVPTKTEPIIAIIPTSIEILVKILRRGEIRRSLRIIFNTLKPPSVHFKNCITSLCNIEVMSYY